MADQSADLSTTKWNVRWTVVAMLALGLPLWALSLNDRTTSIFWFIVGFLTLFVVTAVVSDKKRYLPVVIAPLVVGTWPLYRWLVHQDTRTGEVFLGVTGFLVALLILVAAHQYARRRGWVVDSP